MSLKARGTPASVGNMVSGASAHLVPSGGDDSAQMVAALTSFAPFASPFIVLGPGTFQWNNSVPALLRNTPTRILGAGVDQTFIKLSSGAPRAFDFNKIADADVFTQIELSDFTVDCNNVTGHHHVVIGTYINGAQTTRISVNRFSAKRIRTINVPSDPTTSTSHRLNLWIVPSVTSTDSGYTLNDHQYEDLDFRQGGNIGFVVGGTVTGGAATGQITWDRIRTRAIKHDTGLTNTGSFSSSGVQIGSQAVGGECYVDEIWSANSGDVSVEIDNAAKAVIGSITGIDPWNVVLLLTNTTGVAAGSTILPTQVATVQALRHKATYAGAAATLATAAAATNTFGKIVVDSMALEDTIVTGRHPTLMTNMSAQVVEIGSAHYVIASANDAVTNTQLNPISLTPLVNMRFKLGSYTEALSGTYTAGQLSQISIKDSANAVTLDLQVESMQINTSLAVLHHTGYVVATPALANTTLKGHIRNLRVDTSGALFQGGIYLQFNATSNLPGPFPMENCDFTGAASVGNAEIFVQIAGTTNYNNIRAKSNKYKTAPAPSSLLGLVTATGAQTKKPYACNAVFTQASGAGITAIDYSTDGGTTYTNFLTQASGALPAGFDQVLANVTSDALIRVTFATTQPTVKLVPVDP